jgi:hypothetical protein
VQIRLIYNHIGLYKASTKHIIASLDNYYRQMHPQRQHGPVLLLCGVAGGGGSQSGTIEEQGDPAMPMLNVTEEQVIALLEQLTPEQRAHVLNRFATASGNGSNANQPVVDRPRPTRGKAKNHILYLADDFDAPLEDMKEYME